MMNATETITAATITSLIARGETAFVQVPVRFLMTDEVLGLRLRAISITSGRGAHWSEWLRIAARDLYPTNLPAHQLACDLLSRWGTQEGLN